MTDGYLKPGGSTFHVDQRCEGSTLSLALRNLADKLERDE